MLTRRSVAGVVVLTIITFGIYGIWWTYVTLADLEKLSDNVSTPPILAALLFLFVSSAGGTLLAYEADTKINAIKESCGIVPTDNKILWIVLGAIIPVVTVALVQNEINKLV